MIDTGDVTMFCHWNKRMVCKKDFYCDTCKHQLAADDKENGKLILKGEQSFSFKAGIGHVPGRVHFTLTMEVKDDRYRYTYVITDITSDMDNGASMLPSLKRHPNNGRVKTVMNTIKDSLNDLVQKSYRSFDTSSDANW